MGRLSSARVAILEIIDDEFLSVREIWDAVGKQRYKLSNVQSTITRMTEAGTLEPMIDNGCKLGQKYRLNQGPVMAGLVNRWWQKGAAIQRRNKV